MEPSPCVMHADLDAFYASVEQRDRPELRGRPVIVGGTGGRGVVSAASYEARRFGVHSAMPTAQARQRCPEGVFLAGDPGRYAAESRRLFAIFRDFSPRVEGLSLDEAFLDLRGTERLLGPPAEVGHALRARVREVLGLAVSIGIAPVKMVAKIASAAAKPDGLIQVAPGEVRSFLAPLPVRRIWGVGPVAEQRLLRAGFERVGDLAEAPPERLEALLGDWGLAIGRLARGEDVRDVEPYRAAVSYSEENTFPDDVTDLRRLRAALLRHADSVARRLRNDGVQARTVVLKWRPARRERPGPRGYPLRTRRRTLSEPTDDGAEMARVAAELLDRVGPREPVRLIGLAATNVVAPGAAAQLELFAAAEAPGGPGSPARPASRQRARRLNRALDEIRDRFGREAVTPAAADPTPRAGLTHQHKRGDPPD